MSEPRVWREVQSAMAEAWLAAPRRLLACDFDGTLAPLVEQPAAARLTPTTRSLLSHLARLPRTVVAVVSGRGLADLRERVGLIELIYAGNHGWQITGPGVDFDRTPPPLARQQLDHLGRRARAASDLWPGLIWEDKGVTASLHYRQVEARAHRAVRAFAAELARDALALELHAGARVWEFRPRDDWNKGRAVAWLLAAEKIAEEHAWYLGDDATDEHVFSQLPRGWTVQVGGGRPTTARLAAENPSDVAGMLEWLVGLG